MEYKDKIDSIISKIDKVQEQEQETLVELLEQFKKEIMEGVECLNTKQ